MEPPRFIFELTGGGMGTAETEIHVWCQRCWQSIALPRVNEFAVGAVSIAMVQAVTQRQEYKEFSKFTSDHQSAIIAFLGPLNPACCLLGEAKVLEIIQSFPLKGGGAFKR